MTRSQKDCGNPYIVFDQIPVGHREAVKELHGQNSARFGACHLCEQGSRTSRFRWLWIADRLQRHPTIEKQSMTPTDYRASESKAISVAKIRGRGASRQHNWIPLPNRLHRSRYTPDHYCLSL